jgi:predicted transcriptional regulator
VNNYLSISEIADKTGISNSTCRRYLSTFERFFVVKGGNRLKKYESSAVVVLGRIRDLYNDGQDTDEIYNILVNEFPMVINGDEQQETNNHQVPSLATSDDIAEIKQQLVDQRESMQRQEEFNKALLQKLDEQQKYIEQSIERRDRQLMEVLKESQQARIEAAAATTQEEKKKGFFSRLFGSN